MSCKTKTFLIYESLKKNKQILTKHARRQKYFSILTTENDVIKLLLNEEAVKEYAPRKHRGKVL